MDNRSQGTSSTDDETLESTHYINRGSFITPIPCRHQTFTPPKSMFDGIDKHRRKLRSKAVKKLLPWKRGRSAKTSVPSRASSIRSPYISKTAFNKLSPVLRNSYQGKNSAWEKPNATFRSTPAAHHQCEKNNYTCTQPSAVEVNIPLSPSDSFTLPVVISPAYKFVPIGYDSEEDDCTFSSRDYDICTSNSDLEYNSKYSSVVKDMVESKSFGEANQTVFKSYERSNNIAQVHKIQAEDYLTPFELDQMHSKEESKSVESIQNISETSSLSSLDLVSEEFSLVSLCTSKTSKSQLVNYDELNENKIENKSRDLWLFWEQVVSVMSCGTKSTY